MLEWSRNTSQTFNTIKFLILPMSSIGWYKDSFTKKRTKIFQMLHIIISVIILLFFVAIMMNMVLNNKINIAVNLTTVINSTATIIILIFGNIYIPTRFNKLLIGCDVLKAKKRFSPPNGNIKTGIVICATTYLTIAGIYWISTLYFFISLPSFSILVGFKSCTVLLYCAVYFYQKFVIMSMTHCICWILRAEAIECFKELKKMMVTVPSESQIEEVKRRYIDITDLTEKADNILSPLISTVFASAFAFTCFLVNELAMREQGNIEFAAYFFVLICNAFDITFLLTQGCLLHDSTSACTQLPSKFDGSKMTEKLTGQTVLLLETMKNTEVGISFMKMFILNKPAVLTVIGTLVTYVIIVIQFN